MKTGKTIGTAVKYVFLLSLLLIILLIGLEGVSSLILLGLQLPAARIVAERVHTEYDPLLGWINQPDLFIPDMYGPGKYFRTNSQRFRNDRDFDRPVPPGGRRWICSGDSFTLGYGVANDRTWCAILSSLIPGLQTVNMGQGGYGIDQAYLWVTRDGAGLDYELLIFAFITADFTRALSPRFRDYPKPILTLREGKPAVENVPVPRPGFLTERLPRIRSIAEALKAGQLIRRLKGRLTAESALPGEGRAATVVRTQKLAAAIFQTLREDHRRKNREVLFVYLPTLNDYRSAPNTELMRKFLAARAEENGWFWLDLVGAFRQLDPREAAELFIREEIPGYTASQGHYNERGNRYIAELIRNEIARRPELTDGSIGE